MRYSGNNIKILINSLVVSYTDQGLEDGSVIIFIHGFPLNKTMWDNQVAALKKDYRVISYDIRGHGDSEPGNETFSIKLFVNDLLRLMDELKIEKASLCGLSMGGYIALNAIENHPERFEALVLSDTNCIADSPKVKQKRMDTIESIKALGVEKYVNDSIVHLFAPESFATHTNAISDVKEMILNTSEQSLSKTLLALSQRKATCSKLPEITLPVLFLVGETDEITPPKASELMHEKIKNSTMQIISHAGHLSNLENPNEFNKRLKTFFGMIYKKHDNFQTDGNTSAFTHIRHKLNILLTFILT